MRAVAAILTALSLALAPAAVAAAQDVVLTRVTTGPGETGDKYTGLQASSRDGTRIVFGSNEDLSLDDRVPLWDYFDRVGDQLRLLSPMTGPGPKHEQPLEAVSADARTIVFQAPAHWTPDDADDKFDFDVFRARDGVVERVSTGTTGGNTPGFSADFAGLSGDGERVLYLSAENLTADDTDYRSLDAFAWEAGTTVRLSTGPTGGNSNEYQVGTTVAGHSADARRVIVRTAEPLTFDDGDRTFDLYLREGTQTTKITPGDGPHEATFDAISADGHVVVFHTTERLLESDTDDRSDAYRWAGGALQHVTPGNDNQHNVGYELGRAGGDVLYLTADGSKVVFSSYERLTPDDTDDQLDSYLWAGGALTKVCPGNGDFDAAGHQLPCLVAGGADDASLLVAGSREQLTPDDRDGRIDLFALRGGAAARVTTGPRGGNDPVDIWCLFEPECGRLSFVSVDGSRIVFETEERLVDADTDERRDVYQRAGGVTTLLSPHRAADTIVSDVFWIDGADDGSIAYLETEERLTADDTNLRGDGFRVLPPGPGAGAPDDGGGGGGTPASGADGSSAAAAGGGTATTTTPATVRTTARPAPRLRLLRRPRALTIAGRSIRLGVRGRGLAFGLDRAARVTVLVERLRPGRRSRGRCLAPSRRLRLAPRCDRPAAVAAPLRRHLRAGRHVLRIGGRRVAPGRHLVTLTPAGGSPVRIVVRLRGA